MSSHRRLLLRTENRLQRVSILLCAIVAAALPQAGMANGFRRLAVVSGGEAKRLGIGELLTVALARQEDVELVERDRLDTVLRELKLAEGLAKAGPSQRLRLGQLVSADALILLSVAEGKEQSFLTVVFCDCGSGVRLALDHVPLKQGELAATVTGAADVVSRTRRKYRSGVRFVVGVAPFVSTNLSHRFDHLQGAYAGLLQQALAARPGVAVLEIDEAVAIARELALAPRQRVQRVVPVLVDAEFNVHQGPGQPEGTVAFSVRIRRGGADAEQQRFTTQTARVPELIRARLCQLVLPAAEEISEAIDARAQTEWLVSRAETFSQLGQWHRAAGLREAALLLTPDLSVQRIKLLFEYRHAYYEPRDLMLLIRPRDSRREHADSVSEGQKLSDFQRRLGAFLAAHTHLEYLVRHRKLDRGLALELGEKLCTRRLTLGLKLDEVAPSVRAAAKAEIAEAEAAEAEMLKHVFPKILTLPDTPVADGRWHETNYHLMDLPRLKMQMGNILLDAASSRLDRKHLTVRDLESIKSFMQDVVEPHDISVMQPRHGLRWRSSYAISEPPPDAPSQEEWLQFFRDLTAMRSDVAKVHGYEGLLSMLLWSGADTPETVRIAQEARAWAAKFDPPDVHFGYGAANIVNRLCQRVLDPEPERRVVPPRAGRFPFRPKPAAPGGDASFAKLRLEPVTIRMEPTDASPTTTSQPLLQVDHLTACGDRLDLFWSGSRLLYMTAPGVMKRGPLSDEEVLDDVCWDGESVWLAKNRVGLAVTDIQGRILASIGSEQGLPPCDGKLLVHAVSPGQVIAVGCFGEHTRAWIAQVVRSPSGWRVNVFHRARRVPTVNLKSGSRNERWYAALDDPEMVFEPTHLHECDSTVADPRRVLYVHRRLPGILNSIPKPLAVDLRSLEVTVATNDRFKNGLFVRYPDAISASWTRKTRQHYALHRSHWEPLPENGDPAAAARLCTAPFMNTLVHDRWIYVKFLRVHADTREMQFFVRSHTSGQGGSWHLGSSSHLGLVGWTSDRLWKVTVEPSGTD